MQTVSITTDNEKYSIQHYVIKMSVTCGRVVVFSGFLHDKTEI